LCVLWFVSSEWVVCFVLQIRIRVIVVVVEGGGKVLLLCVVGINSFIISANVSPPPLLPSPIEEDEPPSFESSNPQQKSGSGIEYFGVSSSMGGMNGMDL